MQRDFHKARIIAAFSITVLIFVLIFVANNYFNEIKMNQLNSMYNNIRIDSLNAEVEYQVLSENPCAALNFEPIGNELFDLGSKLSIMENQLGKENQQVLDLKKYYSILQIRQWLFVKKASVQCSSNTTPILFFYSNAGDCDDCESQGFVLNYIRKDRPNTYVYSFDMNLDSSAIGALKISYNITSVPAILIKDKVYYGYRDADNISQLIK
jgi:hypothetical protein